MESEESTEVDAADSRVNLKIDPETARLLRQLCGASLDSRSQPAEVAWLVRRRAVELGVLVGGGDPVRTPPLVSSNQP